MVRTHVFVSGRVQGVAFRHNARIRARRLGLLGWARNLPDGRVEAIFEGEKDSVDKMLEWIRKGPIFSRVDEVEINWEEFIGEFKEFD